MLFIIKILGFLYRMSIFNCHSANSPPHDLMEEGGYFLVPLMLCDSLRPKEYDSK